MLFVCCLLYGYVSILDPDTVEKETVDPLSIRY